jgi:ribonuclease Z
MAIKKYSFVLAKMDLAPLPPLPHEFLVKAKQQGVIYTENGVKVIAFKVDYNPDIPAFEYPIEYNRHSTILSGDTR